MMKKWFLVCLCLGCITSLMASEAKEMLLRSFRLPEAFAVKPRVFRDLAEEQLCERYYIHVVDGKKVVVPSKEWVESINIYQQSVISLSDTVSAKMIPIEAKLEVIKEVAKGEYRATLLEPVVDGHSKPLVFVKVPEGVNFTVGDVEECKLLMEARNAFKAEIPAMLKTYRVLPEDEAKRWWKASAKDLYLAYKEGTKFLVKVKAHRVKCETCDGSGIDRMEYERRVEEIKAEKSSTRNVLSSDSTRTKLKKLNQNKPKCEACDGERFFYTEVFRKLDVNAK